MRHLFVFAVGLLTTAGQLRAESEASIQGRIDAAIGAGGGEVLIPSGIHLITRGLKLQNAKHVRLAASKPGTATLQLGPLAFAQASSAVEAGAREIPVSGMRNFEPGMRIKI